MQFEILGPLRVTVSGHAVGIRSVRQRAVLAVLLLSAGRTVSVDRLVDAVWGDQPADSAVNLVRTYIWRLRSLLTEDGEVRLETEPAGYLLRVKPSELDLAEFERQAADGRAALARGEEFAAARHLRAALDLWRGEPLEDVTLHSGDLLAETLRLNEARVAALEERIEADLAVGRHEELIGELRQHAAQHPLRERITGSLMLACYRSGRQADALGAYRTLRAALVGELGLEPGPALRELHERILEADPELQEVSRVVHRLSARHTPRQLPAAPGHFTGRAAEVRALTALVEHGEHPVGTVVICAIDGMGGIGKTALALHAAHLLADRYPDGQLFLDLHGYTKGLEPREPADALAVILQSLGIPSRQIPPALDARAALYRDRLAETRTLIVLDNAANEEQIRPLLPGSSRCTVLITSRTRLRSLDDARTVPLDLLPADQAVTLLRLVAGPGRDTEDDTEDDTTDDGAVFEQIAELCGRLPLALRIAGGLLRHRAAWTARHLAEKLQESRPGLGLFRDGERDLTVVFELSYRALPDRLQLLFRRLGLLPGPDSDAYAVAALLECGPADAEQSLQSLVDHHLLTEANVGRYRMHDLVRQHAHMLAERDPAPERAAALDRLMDYYQHTAERADARVARYPRPAPSGPVPVHAPDLPDAERAYAWLRAERANLEAGVQRAVAEARDARVVALAAGLVEIVLEDGPLPYAVSLYADASRAAERIGDTFARACALTRLGMFRLMSHDYPGALEDFDRAVALHIEAGDRGSLAGARAERSVVLRITGDLLGAIRELEEALGSFVELDDPLGQAAARWELGLTRYLTGDTSSGVDHLTEALRLYRALGNRRRQADVLCNLGGMQHSVGDLPGSVRSLDEALAIFRELGNRSGEGRTLIEKASALRLSGDLKAAKQAVGEGLQLYHEIRNRIGQAIAWQSRAVISAAAGDLPGALRDFEDSLGFFREVGARGNQAWVLNGYAGAVRATGDSARALTLYREALGLARESTMRDEQAIALEAIGEIQLAHAERSEGAECLTQALAIFQELGQDADADRIEARLAALD
ncbi:MAG TPA: BTAD domain-containing putative transcriptional regulator [Actinospica sp.]|nr:BTAD domain-containing putative transcriptional regulator [Actinospica sp.]